MQKYPTAAPNHFVKLPSNYNITTILTLIHINLNKKELLCSFLRALRFTELSCARRTVSFGLRALPAIPAQPLIPPLNRSYIYVYVVRNFITFENPPDIHYF